jgi:hypothetical protein
MKCSDLGWAAVCFFYRSGGDLKYVNMMSDRAFIDKLRTDPGHLSSSEFEEKAILGYIKIENYDLFLKHKLAIQVVDSLGRMTPCLSLVRGLDILSADLESAGADSISHAAESMYRTLSSIEGVWSTGASKILHLLNDRLFPVVTPSIISLLNLPPGGFRFSEYLKRIQYQAVILAEGCKKISPVDIADHISERLGYTAGGCRKSLVKYIDEYYFLITNGLPVPPHWTPEDGSAFLFHIAKSDKQEPFSPDTKPCSPFSLRLTE